MYNCINVIKNSIKFNKKGFLVKKNLKNINILKAFIKINVLRFLEINNNTITVFINYTNNKPIFKNIINIYKPSKKQFINHKKIKQIIKKNNYLLIISTDIGIINSFEAVKKNKGGLILAKIWN